MQVYAFVLTLGKPGGFTGPSDSWVVETLRLKPWVPFCFAPLQDITSLLHTIYEVVDSSVNHSPTSSKTLRVKLTVAPDGSQGKKGILLNHPGEGLEGRPGHRGQSTASSQKDHTPAWEEWERVLGVSTGSDSVDRRDLSRSLKEQDLDREGITGGGPCGGKALEGRVGIAAATVKACVVMSLGRAWP